MCCTFGDLTDVIWWRELQLNMRAIISRDGRLIAEAPDGLTDEKGITNYNALAGKSTKQAQTAIAEMLATSGEMVGEPRPITHPVKFYEKGDRPLEIVTSRQWYIRNGGRDAELRDALLARGAGLTWHPDHMRHRYSNWVEGLNGDWLVSRQRWFGVPIPVWYKLNEHGEVLHESPLVPNESHLPIDPSTDVPEGFNEAQRGQPGGFIGDPDVMDTWATSSLTPQIAGKWEDDNDLFARVYPFDVRPQAHDIIRTWLFATMVRSHFEHKTAPWSNAALSGWILDPDRKKMSKSKGNVVTPVDLFEQYGSDAVRYWAASARPGVDTAFSEDQMKVGRKLATKILNVTKFVLGFGDADESVAPTEQVDCAMLHRLAAVVEECTTAFEAFDYARALERTESFFWWFCDDYVELVKTRAYSEDSPEGSLSARIALRRALSTLQRLFAPLLPFATEEVWNWWQTGSVHQAQWPTSAELTASISTSPDEALLNAVCTTLAIIRRSKTEAKVSQRQGVDMASITASADAARAITAGWIDIANAGSVAQWEIAIAENAEIAVVVTLAPVAQ
jgi:valyl-tRNA synthetase